MLEAGYSIADLVILGFKGTSLSREILQTLAKEKASQFILFGPNYESKRQLIELTDEIQRRVQESGSPLPAMISADQEGGRVARFRKEFTLIPAAGKIGALQSPNAAFDITKVQAKELFLAGIQLNFAPVCDVNTNPANPVIGDRAYGSDADSVARTASAVVRGHLTENVEPCLKHFPGHGDTHVDSHHSLPTVNTPLETLREREWIPFHRAMKSGCNFVMSAHILLPHLDAEFPGTFSATFIEKYLRQELMFQGAVISDDMEMGAVVSRYGAEEAPILALNAGCDLLCYRSESQAVLAIEAIRKGLQDKKLNPEKLKTAIDRVRKIRKNLKLASTSLNLTERAEQIGSLAHQQVLEQHFPSGL